jgi:hypothetical protein
MFQKGLVKNFFIQGHIKASKKPPAENTALIHA